MLLKDFAALVSKTAPVLGALLGTPISGIVISALANHFGSGNNFDLASLASSIEGNEARLKEIEYAHQEKLVQVLEQMAEKTILNVPKPYLVLVSIISVMTVISIVTWLLLNAGS